MEKLWYYGKNIDWLWTIAKNTIVERASMKQNVIIAFVFLHFNNNTMHAGDLWSIDCIVFHVASVVFQPYKGDV